MNQWYKTLKKAPWSPPNFTFRQISMLSIMVELIPMTHCSFILTKQAIATRGDIKQCSFTFESCAIMPPMLITVFF